MEITKLNELIECSICLSELNIQHKMLPCQHTFCLVCLNKLTKFASICNPVMCPECQSTIPMDIDLLSTNIMVMRLIEAKSKLSMIPSDDFAIIPITQVHNYLMKFHLKIKIICIIILMNGNY